MNMHDDLDFRLDDLDLNDNQDDIATLMQLTSKELTQLTNDRWDELIDYCGGNVHLARMVGFNINNVNSWGARKRISKDGAIQVGQHKRLGKKFNTLYLRPDMNFPNLIPH